MATRFTSNRIQAALSTPTAYRRRFRFTFTRGGVSRVLEPTGGTFTQDARRNGRWDGRLSFLSKELLPQRPGDLLTPFGTTVTVEAGLELLDGTTGYVPYGVYDIDSVGAEVTAGQRSIDVSLIDLSDRVDRYRFESPFLIGSGFTLSQMINTIITNRTGFSPGLTTIPFTLGAKRVFGLESGTGPWNEIQDALKPFSLVGFYDRQGGIRVINPSTANIAPYAITSPTSLSIDFDTRPANVVVARGESSDDTVTPVQAIAMDLDPGSPTYAGTGAGTSPYGRRTEYFSSPLILTAGQALAAAQTILAENLGAGASYTMTMPYDPTVDVIDVLAYAGGRYAVDAITLDITGETTAKVRRIG